MKNDQNGFSHIVLIIAIALVVGIISFAGYTVARKNDAKSSNASAAAIAAKQKESTEAVKAEPAASAAPSTTTQPSSTATTPTPQPQNGSTSPAPSPAPAPQKRTITFTKGGGSVQGDVVRVSANLSENQVGTCTYSFSLNGTERVRETSGVSNDKQCFNEIPVSKFPKSATYSFALTFVSTDGLVTAAQAAYDIEVK